MISRIRSFRIKSAGYTSVLIGLLIGVFGVLFVFKDLIMSATSQVLWADQGDPKLIYWIVNWGYHVLVENADPVNFWNAL